MNKTFQGSSNTPTSSGDRGVSNQSIALPHNVMVAIHVLCADANCSINAFFAQAARNFASQDDSVAVLSAHGIDPATLAWPRISGYRAPAAPRDGSLNPVREALLDLGAITAATED